MDELRECPFCGNKELRRNNPNNFIPEYIHCDECGGMNGLVAWNTRAADEIIHELLKALDDFMAAAVTDDLDDIEQTINSIEQTINKAKIFLNT